MLAAMRRTKLTAAVLLLPVAAAVLAGGVAVLACSDETPSADSGTPPVDSSADTGSTDTGADTATDAPAGSCPRVGDAPDTVALTTDDGVSLEADYYGVGVPGGGAAILLHMIPPSNDRSNYPRAFIDELTERDVAVLNVDRRGAGGSGGDPQDAYEGPSGWLDAKAAFDWLATHGCGFAMNRIVLVGASNGTTSVLDFTIETADDVARGPAALVFLTGGGYTENQHRVSEERALLDTLPIRFVYSTAEAAWSAQFETGAAAGWVFDEYADGDHGTLMFAAAPESVGAVADFVAAAANP